MAFGNAVRVGAGAVVVAVIAGCGGPATAPTPPTTTSVSSPPSPSPAPSSAAPFSAVPGSASSRSTPAPVPSNPPVPAGVAGRPRGEAGGPVDGQSPDAVAAAFAASTFTYDTAIDRSPFDAQVRSAVYATPAFAGVLKQPLQQGGGAQWNTLAAHHGYSTVALAVNHDDGRPPDQLRAAARGYTITVTGHGENGWTAPLDSQTMYVFLTRTGTTTPWQVARVSFRGGS